MPEGDQAQQESDLLKKLLALREIPCPVCGYNLRAIESDKCPECGAKLDLKVGSSDLKLGLGIAAILGVALPLGFGMIMLLLFSYVGFRDGVWRDGEVNILISLLFLTMVDGLALGLLWSKRRRFWRSATHNQQKIAFMCIGVSAVLAMIVSAVLLNS